MNTLKINEDIFDDHQQPLHKPSQNALLSDAELFLEDKKMRGSL
jgi:hypothetical protein